MKTYNDGKSRSDWDYNYATYYWQIHLDPNHPDNRTDKITGYSKKRLQSEAQDKTYLLKKKIEMLYNRGYFGKMKHIDIFQRVGTMVDKQNDPKILILYPTHFDIRETIFFETIFKTQKLWLQLLYEAIQKGQGIDHIIPSTRAGKSQDYYLDPTQRDHLTIDHLVAYTNSLEQHGHPPGAITDYYRKVKAMKKW